MTGSRLSGSAGISTVSAVLWGEEEVLASSASERAARCLIIALFLALPLFVTLELSPTIWALATALFLVLCHPHLPNPRVLHGLQRPLACWMAFAALAAVSASWSLDPSRSWRAAVVLASYIGTGAIIISYIVELSEMQRARVWSALVAGAATALIELTAIEIYSVLTHWDAARTFHKITFYGLLAAAVLLNIQTKNTGLQRGFLLAFFAIPTLLMGKTSGINLMILATAVLCFLRARQRRRLLLAVLFFYCALALLAPFLADFIFHLADQSTIGRLSSVTSFMARLELWKLMAPYIIEHPWFGHGADTVRISEFIIQHVVKYYDLPDIPSAHNMVFDQWYELGLVGVLSLLAIGGMTLRDMMNSACRYNLSAAVIFLGFVVEFSVDHRIWLSWVQGVAIFAASVLVLIARTPEQMVRR